MAGDFPKELLSKVSFVDYKTSIREAKEMLKKVPVLVVRKDGLYYGIIDRRAIYRHIPSIKASGSEKVHRIVIHAPRITNATTLNDAAYYFCKSGLKALAYEDDGKILGAIERQVLLKMMLSTKVLERMRVGDYATTPALAINSAASISQAISAMRANKVHRLLVMKKDRFEGIVTNRDIHVHNLLNDRNPEKSDPNSPAGAEVESITERNVASIDNDAMLPDAARMMVERGVSSVVVTSKNKPAGIITMRDIFEGVVGVKNMDERNVFITGFDETTYQFEDSVKEELKSLMERLERMHRVDVGYVTMRIKRVKLKSYELHARISLGNKGMVSMHASGNSFHEAFSDLMKRMKEKVAREKEIAVSSKRKLDPRSGFEYVE